MWDEKNLPVISIGDEHGCLHQCCSGFCFFVYLRLIKELLWPKVCQQFFFVNFFCLSALDPSCV